MLCIYLKKNLWNGSTTFSSKIRMSDSVSLHVSGNLKFKKLMSECLFLLFQKNGRFEEFDNMEFAIPIFHNYGHKMSCQVSYMYMFIILPLLNLILIWENSVTKKLDVSELNLCYRYCTVPGELLRWVSPMVSAWNACGRTSAHSSRSRRRCPQRTGRICWPMLSAIMVAGWSQNLVCSVYTIFATSYQYMSLYHMYTVCKHYILLK